MSTAASCPRVESLEIRTLYASAALDSSFTVIGEAKSTFGAQQVAELVRLNPVTGARSIVAKLETPGGLVTSFPLLTGVKAGALAPNGELVLVGSKPSFPTPSVGDVTRVLRVNPGTGVATVIKDFPPPGSFNAPALITKATEVTVNAAGDIFLAGIGPRVGSFSPVPEIVKISASTGNADVVAQFFSLGLNTLPLLTTIGGLSTDAAGNVFVVGEGRTFSSVGVGSRIVKVNPSTGVQTVVADFTQLSGIGLQVVMKNAVGIAAAPDGTIYVAGQTFSGNMPVVARANPSNGGKSFLTQFPSSGAGNPAKLTKLTDIAFAPAQNKVVVVGTKAIPGVPASAGQLNALVVRIDRTTGTQSVVSQVAGLPSGPGFLTRAVGITAGLTRLTALPKPTITGPTATLAGMSTTFTISSGATTAADRAKIRRLLIDWNGDGSVDQIQDGTSNTIVSHAFTRCGTYNVLISAVRFDGSVSPFGSTKIRVNLPKG